MLEKMEDIPVLISRRSKKVSLKKLGLILKELSGHINGGKVKT